MHRRSALPVAIFLAAVPLAASLAFPAGAFTAAVPARAASQDGPSAPRRPAPEAPAQTPAAGDAVASLPVAGVADPALARRNYEVELVRLGEELLAIFDKDTRSKIDAQPNPKLRDALRVERRRFLDEGLCPDVLRAKEPYLRWLRLRLEMIKVYEDAATAALKSEDDEREAQMREELEAFKHTDDLAPWQNLFERVDPELTKELWKSVGTTMHSPGNDKGGASNPLAFAGPFAREYALSFEIQRREGGGNLVAGLIDDEGQRLELVVADELDAAEAAATIESGQSTVISIRMQSDRIAIDRDGVRTHFWAAGDEPLADTTSPESEWPNLYLRSDDERTRLVVVHARYKALGRFGGKSREERAERAERAARAEPRESAKPPQKPKDEGGGATKPEGTAKSGETATPDGTPKSGEAAKPVAPAKPAATKPTNAAKPPKRAVPKGREPAAPAWAEVIEARPDPAVVTDEALFAAIVETGLAWRVRDRESRLEMLLVPPARYFRGNTDDDLESDLDEMPGHSVSITRAFYLGRYEVQAVEWTSVVDGGSPPSSLGMPRGDLAFEDVEGFFRAMRKSRPAAPNDPRLPTEAEWELACRAGVAQPRYGTTGDIAWSVDTSKGSLQLVGGKKANALGFHDMLGNVWEWCADFYDAGEYVRVAADPSLAQDPIGPPSGPRHTLRGGSAFSPAKACRASNREKPVHARAADYGFRVARDP